MSRTLCVYEKRVYSSIYCWVASTWSVIAIRRLGLSNLPHHHQFRLTREKTNVADASSRRTGAPPLTQPHRPTRRLVLIAILFLFLAFHYAALFFLLLLGSPCTSLLFNDVHGNYIKSYHECSRKGERGFVYKTSFIVPPLEGAFYFFSFSCLLSFCFLSSVFRSLSFSPTAPLFSSSTQCAMLEKGVKEGTRCIVQGKEKQTKEEKK